MPPEKAAELRVKHLEMIQGVITRLATGGATFKNYCLTITTAICGLGVSLQRPAIAALAILPVLVFALLDAQFLRIERSYRAHFDQVRNEDWSAVPSFSMTPTSHVTYRPALQSWSITSFYGCLAAGVVLIAILIGVQYGRTF